MKDNQDQIKISAEMRVCYEQLESTARRFPRSIARKTLGALFLSMLDEEISMLQANPVAAAVAMNEIMTTKELVDKIVDNHPQILGKIQKKADEKKKEGS